MATQGNDDVAGNRAVQVSGSDSLAVGSSQAINVGGSQTRYRSAAASAAVAERHGAEGVEDHGQLRRRTGAAFDIGAN